MSKYDIGLYDNDVSYEVCEYYKKCLIDGMSSQEAETAVISYFSEELSDSDDGPVVVLALADTAWCVGRLSEKLKKTAIEIIDSGEGLERWEEAGIQLLKKRKAVLQKLKVKLLSPQPAIKVLRKHRVYICPWKIGDVFAYQLNGKEAEKHGLKGKWLILQKVNQADNLKGGLSPVFTVRIADTYKQSNLDLLKLPCVRICKYMGYKWSYRLHIYLYSSRTLFYKSLIYLGNEVLSLADDDYPHENNAGYKEAMPEFFEETVINSYLKYGLGKNLR